MRLLLDTHVFLWWLQDAPALSSLARTLIEDSRHEIFLSAASGWEIVIKAALGKLTIADEPAAFLADQLTRNNIIPLAVQMSHAMQVFTLPPHHRDPFDRMLVAQAQLEKMPLLTADAQIRKYEVETLW